MPTYDWKPFLEQWSRELIAADQADLRQLPAEVVASGWLGYPGATEKQISELEWYLDMPLPPSYRQFLEITNGWRSDGFGLDLVIAGTEQINWFQMLNHIWFDQVNGREAESNRQLGGYRHPDDYMPDVFDSLKVAPQIGTSQQERVYLFDPREVIDGEWQAWTINKNQTIFQQSMRPKYLELYDSFWALMHALYERFHNESELYKKSKSWQPSADFVPLEYDWRPFLEQYSRDLLGDVQIADSSGWPDEVIASSWIGLPGATEGQIVALEVRIGTRLPPSYRQFLAITNGWPDTGAFIFKMWSAEEVDWFRLRNKQWIDIWNNIGDGLDPDHERRDMKTALEISEESDSAIMLLNPQVITPDGEWEAWFFSNWGPGADRYPSFWALMHHEYETMMSFMANDKKHLSSKADPAELPAKLPNLVGELRVKANMWASMTSGPTAEYNNSQAQVLNATADQVQSLIDSPHAPTEILAALRAIAEQAERERAIAEASGQTTIESALGDLNSKKTDAAEIMSRLTELIGQVDFEQAAMGMADKGHAQGLSQAAAIIRWFINASPT